MKNSRKLILIVLLALLLVAALTVAACTPDDPTHQHTFAQEWSSNRSEHWHAATCGHKVTSDRAAHNFGTDDVCDTCGYTKGQGGDNPGGDPTHQHTFAEQWSISESEHWHAATCNHDVTADNAAHTLVNNVCSVCGYQNNVNWDDFTFEQSDDGYILTKYNGTAAHVNIPDTYNNLPVVGIGFHAYECESLVSVTIPNSVTSIGRWAFSYCDNLTTVKFGANSQLESIGDYAFADCDCLTSITIPDGITSIGECAFEYCFRLTSITLPDCVASIGHCAFNRCNFTSINIPDSVTYIGDGAFESCINLSTVNFGANSKLEIIGDGAFAVCSSLTDITIPDGVTSIGRQSFVYCSGLTSITIPDSVTSIGDGVFGGCVMLTSIAIPDGVTSIGNGAFEGCGNLTSIAIPDSVTSIGDGTFADCSSLTAINIPDGVTSIGSNAFAGNTSLATVNIGPNSKLESIEHYAFCGCVSLTSLTIPDSVTRIENDAFLSCYSLVIYCESPEQPSGWVSDWNSTESFSCPVVWNCKQNNVADDGYEYEIVDGIRYGFKDSQAKVHGNNYFGDVTIPSSVNYKGKVYAVTSIDDGAFALCYDLVSVTVPSSVTNIGNFAFGGANSFVIYCETSEQQSGWDSDWNGDGVFQCPVVWNCKQNNVADDGYIYGVVDGIHYGFKDNQAKVISGNYSGDIKIPATVQFHDKNYAVTSIANFAFCACAYINHITIPNSVAIIGLGAFFGCSNLTTITIPDSVTYIGDGAFYNCNSLTSITIPDGVTYIGEVAFYNCNSLISITIPDNVTSIGNWAFENCYSLTSIFIPKSVTNIGYRAFYDCYNLTIYVEVAEKPSNWDRDWEDDVRDVVWGATRQDAEQH